MRSAQTLISKTLRSSGQSELKSEEGAPPTSPLKEYGAKEEFGESARVSSPLLTMRSTDSEKPEKTEKKNAPWKYAIFGRLQLVGYVLGLGNIVIFPDMYFRNGRLAFLIPLLLSYIFIGMPVFLIELIMGQFSSLSPHKLFSRVAPMLSTIAGGMSIMTFYRSMYFMPFLAQTLYLWGLSLQNLGGTSEWDNCQPNIRPGSHCVALSEVLQCEHHWINETSKTDFIQIEPSCQRVYSSVFGAMNVSDTLPQVASTPHMQYLSDTIYRNTYILDSPTSEASGWPGPLGVVLCLIGLWAIVAVSIFVGPSIFAYIGILFTAIPMILISVFMFYSVSAIENSTDFLSALLTADFSALLRFQTWSDAVSYVLFSLSLADGGVINIASHHHFDNNLILDVLFAIGADILVTFMYLITYVIATGWVLSHLFPSSSDALTSIMSTPGNGRLYSLTTFPDMMEASTGNSTGAKIMVILHYLSILLFGLPSMVVSLEMVINAITERFIKASHHRRRRILTHVGITIGSCCLLCFLTMLMITPGGHYLMHQILDNSINTLVIIAFMEVCAVVYFYGYDSFIQNIEAMLGVQSTTAHYIEAVIWKGVTPLACLFAFFARVIHSFGSDFIVLDYVVPTDMKIIGWFMILVNIGIVPAYIGYKVYKMRQQKRYWRVLLKPCDNWEKPAEVETEAKSDIMRIPMMSILNNPTVSSSPPTG